MASTQLIKITDPALVCQIPVGKFIAYKNSDAEVTIIPTNHKFQTQISAELSSTKHLIEITEGMRDLKKHIPPKPVVKRPAVSLFWILPAMGVIILIGVMSMITVSLMASTHDLVKSDCRDLLDEWKQIRYGSSILHVGNYTRIERVQICSNAGQTTKPEIDDATTQRSKDTDDKLDTSHIGVPESTTSVGGNERKGF